jgi:hypothetical protein
MAGTVSLTEMEMEMEMEMDAGPSTPFPLASPVVRPIGVSPVVASEPGDWYRGNKWPPADHPEVIRDLRVVPEQLRVKREEGGTGSQSGGDPSEKPPERQWTSNFYSIAVVAEFVGASVDLTKLKPEERKRLGDINKEHLKWDTIDLPDYPNEEHTNEELKELVRLIDYRPNVLSEALAQRDGIDDYFRGILSFTPSSHPRTFGLMQIALRVGEFQVMHYKYKFNRMRPSHLCPWLMPPIEVPGHASYPSGHATQSHLVALILGEVMPEPLAGRSKPLWLLAKRIARNREVLGLHYPSDSIAGTMLAQASFRLLRKCGTVRAMSEAAAQEWGRAVANGPATSSPAPTSATRRASDPRPRSPE